MEQQGGSLGRTDGNRVGTIEPFDFEMVPEMTEFQARTIAARRGDMVIWSSYLPHGSGKNTDDTCRLCQCAHASRSPALPSDFQRAQM